MYRLYAGSETQKRARNTVLIIGFVTVVKGFHKTPKATATRAYEKIRSNE